MVHHTRGAEGALVLVRALPPQLGCDKVYPLHRLDRQTSGVLVFALSSHAASEYSAQIRAARWQKQYLALCRGVIEAPVTLLADHIGFYAGAQTIPGGGCSADLTGDGAVDVFDLLAYLDLWFAASPRADLDGSTTIDVFDLLAYVSEWFAGC